MVQDTVSKINKLKDKGRRRVTNSQLLIKKARREWKVSSKCWVKITSSFKFSSQLTCHSRVRMKEEKKKIRSMKTNGSFLTGLLREVPQHKEKSRV